MGAIKVNFADVPDGDFTPIPGGVYLAKVTDGELREAGDKAKNPGSQYVNWEFTIQDGEYAGRKQWMNTSLLPDALFGLKGLLGATGKFNVDGDLNFDIEDVIGSDVAIVVRIQEYQGEKQNAVKRVKPVSEAGVSEAASVLP